MLDYLFSMGQAASALLVFYGGYLVTGLRLRRFRKNSRLDSALEDELLLLRHIHNDA